ncbi:hypothetical protein OHS71_03000 [Streptomyces sp. NBC_00377]|uniref:hypothetical protein n=1 Tax=unclassified Streptomyces TaxID=2593676 RepID=UPI002E1D7393|nr:MULTISPECIES: hypothetical protein [unclassified Streptomyces]
MLGTVLAVFGHHAVAEGTVPWRLVTVLVVAQFAAVRPLARRRYGPAATVGTTLAMQGVLHLALACADGDTPRGASPGPTMHAGHMAATTGDGHAWHHAGAAMTTLHTTAAVVVAWLLHRADTRMTAALDALRTLARAAAAALVQLPPSTSAAHDPVTGRLPRRWTGVFLEAVAQARQEALEHAVVRRGPPRREHSSVLHRPRCPRGRILPYPQGVALCPRPPVRRRVPAVVSSSPPPSR